MMKSIIDYPYLHEFFNRAVSVYGPWLTQNSRVIYTDVRGRTDISSISVKSITSKIAHFVINDPRIEFHNNFFMFDRRKSISNDLPEAVTQEWLPVDLSQLSGMNHTLDHAATDPQLSGKILIDISKYSNRDGAFINLPALHRLITRDYLSRTFYAENQVWWSIDFITYLAAIYSIAAGERSVASLHLDVRSLMKIRLIFAVYFVAQCLRSTSNGTSHPDVKSAMDRIQQSYKTIVPAMFMEEMEVRELMESFAWILQSHNNGDAFTHGMTLDHVILLIKSMNVHRLDGISVQVLRSANQRLLSNPIESFAGLEYPPMFTYGVLCALSAHNAGNIGFTMQKTKTLAPIITKLRDILNMVNLYPTGMTPSGKIPSNNTPAPSQPTPPTPTMNPLAL